MATETRTVIVKVDTSGSSGLKDIANQMKQLNKNTKETSDTLGKLKSGLLAVAATFGVGTGFRELTNIADSMLLLTDRISVFTGSSEKAGVVVNKLAEVANYTKVSITDLGSVFNRFAVSTQSLGLTSDALLSTVQLLQQTFRLSGASAEEAAGSTIQLSQAFSLGKLSGQELRSVLLGNATLAGILRKEVAALGQNFEEFTKKGLLTPSFLLKALSKNFVDINAKADKLGQTFGQTLTIATNQFAVAVGDLNKEFDLNGKFAKGVQFLIDNLPTIKAILTGLAIVTLPLLAVGLAAIAVPVLGFIAGLSPLIITIGLLGTAISTVLFDLDRFKVRAQQVVEILKVIGDTIISKFGAISQFFGEKLGIRALEEFGIALRGEFAEGAKLAAQRASNLQKELNGVFQSVADLKRADEGSTVLKNFIPPDLADKAKGQSLADRIKGIETQIGNLNSTFNKGKIDVEVYNNRLNSLSIKLLEIKQSSGKLSLNKFAEEVAKLNREDIGRLFEYGKLSLDEYNAALKQLDLGAVTQKFNEGKISALAYHQEILKLSEDFSPGSALFVGVNNYIESSGTLAQNIAKNITLVFNTLEDTLVEFVKTGTFEFRKFAQAVLDDLTRIIIRATIIQPLAAGILGSFAPAGGAAGQTSATASVPGAYAAKGYAPPGSGVNAFASGGIVNSPTMFKYGSGSTGIMGEAGPEAILPLERDGSGKLGVRGGGSNVQINIINQTGGEVEQTEREAPGGERVIDILITNKVKEGFANGSFDKAMSNFFGVKRQAG